MQLIDTHVHINFDVFKPELEAVRQRWLTAGVVALVHSCVEPAEFPAIASIARQFPEVFCAVGLHPLDADKWLPASAAEILSLARLTPKVVAIGETGLDFYKAENREIQEKVFLTQLEIAKKLDKPVIIHCRDAAERMQQLLRHFWAENGAVRGVMHCWGGDVRETEWFLDLGFYISFSGIVTFKKATQIQASARIVPADRLLIETDCPFLAPVPKRGKRNEPAYVLYVAEQVAALRGVSVAEIARTTTNNACQLFGITVEGNSDR